MENLEFADIIPDNTMTEIVLEHIYTRHTVLITYGVMLYCQICWKI